jgi:hypothetical protein
MAIQKCLISKTNSDDGYGNRSITSTFAHIVNAVVGGLVVLNYSGPKYEGWRVVKIFGEATSEEMARATCMDRRGWDTTPFGCMLDSEVWPAPVLLETARPDLAAVVQ